jgi:hypothetical protein
LSQKVFTLVLDVLNRIAPSLARRWSHPAPELTIERADHAGSHDLDRNTVHVALAISNTGRGAAQSYRAEARTRQAEGVSLHLLDPSHPGDTTFRRQGDYDVIEWQSADLWPPGQARTIKFLVTMPQDRLVPIDLRLFVPDMKPVHRRIEVVWSGAEPLIQIITPV